MKVEKEGMPRRHRIDLFTPIEKSIYDLQGELEKMGADVRLTDALNLLIQARWNIADFVEEYPRQSQPKREQGAEEILDNLSQKVGLINFKNAVKHVWLKQWSCTALIRLVHSAMEEYANSRAKEITNSEIKTAAEN